MNQVSLLDSMSAEEAAAAGGVVSEAGTGKILYFERENENPIGELPSSRIRTAFRDGCGRTVCLECRGKVSYTGGESRFFGRCENLSPWRGSGYHLSTGAKHFEYTNRGILRLVKLFGGYFEKVSVLPYLAGYSVYDGIGGFNHAEDFILDGELLRRREAARAYFAEKADTFCNAWFDKHHPALLWVQGVFSGSMATFWVDLSVRDWFLGLDEAGKLSGSADN